jgi:hypothetical protein
VRQQLADAHQVALADGVDHEGVGGIEGEAVGAGLGVQRFEPGLDVLGRKFGFETFQAAGPGGIHDVLQWRIAHPRLREDAAVDKWDGRAA